MNAKINLQQLAKILAKKKNMPQKDAEAFLREFFDSIIQNVTTEKLVKIKGLGTFKLIEVLDRESVHVSTGERFIIPGHSKLSFTPETALKDTINKPFAAFQTVIINEGTNLEDMEWTPQPPFEEEEEPEEIEQDTPAQQSQTEEEDKEEVVEEVVEEEEEPETEDAPIQESVSMPIDQIAVLYGPPPAEPVQEPIIEEEDIHAPKPETDDKKPKTDNKKPKTDDKKPNRSFAKILAWTAGIAFLCLVCFFAGRCLTHHSTDSKQVEPQVATPAEVPVEAPVEAPVEEIQYAQVPNGAYKIVGTRKTYIMKPGDFITRIAIQEYGDKDFTQYIIVHNNFPDPDNVPVDMEIKLPELEPVE